MSTLGVVHQDGSELLLTSCGSSSVLIVVMMGMKALSAMRAAEQVSASKTVAIPVVTRPKPIGQFISMSALPSVRPAVQQALQKSAAVRWASCRRLWRYGHFRC